MKIEIQDNEIFIVNLGNSAEYNGVTKRSVTFEIKGHQFDRDVILGPNGTGEEFNDPEKFYMMNKEQVDASLIEYLSENHLYDTRENDNE